MKAKNHNSKHLSNEIVASDFMPKDQETYDVLRKRSQLFSIAHEVDTEQRTSLINYIRFKLGQNEFYGIPYDKIKEVINTYLLTHVPKLPPYIAGVINLRGTLIAVINLKTLFSIPNSETTDNAQIIVVYKENTVVGMLVDTIIGNDVYEPSSLDLPILSQSIKQEFIVGINDGDTAIINIDTILADPNFHWDAKSRAVQ